VLRAERIVAGIDMAGNMPEVTGRRGCTSGQEENLRSTTERQVAKLIGVGNNPTLEVAEGSI